MGHKRVIYFPAKNMKFAAVTSLLAFVGLVCANVCKDLPKKVRKLVEIVADPPI